MTGGHGPDPHKDGQPYCFPSAEYAVTGKLCRLPISSGSPDDRLACGMTEQQGQRRVGILLQEGARHRGRSLWLLLSKN